MSYRNKDRQIADLLEERSKLMQENDRLIGKIWSMEARNKQLVDEINGLRKKVRKILKKVLIYL